MWRVTIPPEASPAEFFRLCEIAPPMPKGPCLLDIEVKVAIPKDWPQREQNRAWANIIWPTDTTDLAVLEALLMPAFEGIPICQVVKRKHYSKAPGIVVCLSPL